MNGARRGGALLADQIVSSSTTLILSVAVARTGTRSEFGRFGLALTIFVVAIALWRASGGQLLLLYGERAPWVQLRNGAVLASALLSALTVMLGVVTGSTITIAVGAALPVLLLQDVLRYRCLASGKVRAALTADCTWLAGQLVLFSLAYIRSGTTTTYVAAWALAALASTGLLASQWIGKTAARPDSTSWRLALSALGAEAVLAILAGQVAIVALATQSGTGSVADLRGSQLLLSPFASLATALPPLLIVAARAAVAEDRVRQWLARWAVASAALLATYGIAWYLLPADAGRSVLGETWSGARRTLPLMALAQGLSLIAVTASLMARLRHGPLTTFRGRLIGSSLEAAGSSLTAPYGARAVAGALAFAQCVQGSLVLRRALQPGQSDRLL